MTSGFDWTAGLPAACRNFLIASRKFSAASRQKFHLMLGHDLPSSAPWRASSQRTILLACLARHNIFRVCFVVQRLRRATRYRRWFLKKRYQILGIDLLMASLLICTCSSPRGEDPRLRATSSSVKYVPFVTEQLLR